MKYAVVICLLALAGVASAQEKKQSPQRLFELGEEAHDAGDYASALAYFSKCLTADPGYTEAYFLRASTREQLGDLEGALTDFSIYLEQRPNEADALFGRGLVRYQLKKYDQAYEDFTQFLRVPPGATQAIYFNKSASAAGTNQIMTAQSTTKPLIYNYLGVIDQKRNNPQASIAWLDSAIQLNPREADYYVNRALSRQILKDSTGALNDFQKALMLNPAHTVALHNIAVFKRTKGEPSKKGPDDPLEQAIESDSSMLYPYLERAYQRMEGGYLKGALEDYDRALAIEQKDPEIWLSRGIVKERLKDYTGAFSDYTQAIQLKEDFVKAWINRANVLLKLERYNDAIEDYTAVLVYTPEQPAAYYNRAVARHKLKQTQQACDDLSKAEALGMKVDAKLKTKVCEGK